MLGSLIWVGICIAIDEAVWIPSVPLLAAGLYASALAVEFCSMRRRYSTLDELRPSNGQLFAAWVSEVTVAPMVFLWWQPFRNRVVHDRVSGGTKRGVVFVHGFVCNRGVWLPWLRQLQADPDRDFIAVDLEPVFGPIERYAATVADAVERVRRSTGRAPLVVAHSMGGLAVRYWLASTGHWRDVYRVVTIATPHAGTQLSRRAGPTNAGQMAYDSRWLRALAAMEDATARAKFVCFWGHCDNIVFPNRSAALSGADNRHVAETPHLRMAMHPGVMDAVMHIADEPD